MAALPASRYQIIGHLASGGMGEILLARRVGPVGFEKLVVLKRPLGATTRAHVTALIDEARLLARINHPNVCQVHDLEEGDDGYFLVLEYLEGVSFWTLLVEAERTDAPLEPAAVCGLLEQVCDGLDAIHALTGRDGHPAGIVHRDISPGNLFLTEIGVAKILDLGIAKTDESSSTAPGAGPRGKLPYLSPEQVAGRVVDRRADVFSLGLVLYDLARGRRPEPHRVGALAAPELDLETLAAPLATVIRTAVAIDPARRFATASDMATAIRSAGHALGGSFGRAELGRWLIARAGPALAARQAKLRGGVAEARSITRRVELRSLVHDAVTDPDDDPQSVGTQVTAALPQPAPLIQEREHPAIAEVQALVAANGRPPSRRPWGRRRGRAATAALASAVVAAGALGASAWWRSGGVQAAAPRPAGAPTSAAAALEAPSSSTPAPTNPVPAPAPMNPVSTPDVPVPTPAERRAAPPAATPARRPRARLSIDSDPFAMIDLDGKPLGATPLYHVSVASGRHVLRAETGDGRVQRRAIDVTPGAVSAVVLHWTAGAARPAK